MARIVGTSGNDSLLGTSSNDTIEGLAGNDTLVGNAGSDSLIGGAGDDLYVVGSGDTLNDSGGMDTVQSTVNWTLGTAFENLTLTGTSSASGTGNELANVITGNTANNWLRGRGGNDTIYGGGGNDTFNMSLGAGGLYGSDYLDGGAGTDTLDFGAAALSAVIVDLAAGTVSGGGTGGAGSATLVSVENANGGIYNDRLTGNASANRLFGYNGNDTLNGGAGRDRLEGGAGNDQYVFSATPGTADADTLVGFVSGADKIVLLGFALGADGNFAAGDARFRSGAFSSGQDADDRIIYNTGNGQLWYDADGNGSGAAQLIATLQNIPALSATDIVVSASTGGTGGSGSPSSGGTAGNDSLVGGSGNDSLDGFEGNDTLSGNGGNDFLRGGAGTDSISGGDGNDTIDAATIGPGEQIPEDFAADSVQGGFGDDLYYVRSDDLISDSGGTDTVVIDAWNYTLPAGFENLRYETYSWSDGEGYAISYRGNAANNRIEIKNLWHSSSALLDGGDGNDTLIGSGQVTFKFSLGSGNYGNDRVEGGSWSSTVDFADARSAIVANIGAGTLTGGGTNGAGSVTMVAIDNVIGGAFNDRIVASATGENYFSAGYIRGGGGNDTLEGVAGGNGYDLFGGEGNDRLIARASSDHMEGGAGADAFVLARTPGGTNSIGDFISGTDEIVLDASFMSALGASGQLQSGDDRFHFGTGAADAEDRVIYNTSTNELFYDADGSGGGSAQLIVRLQPGASLTATDIEVTNGAATPPPPPPPTGGGTGQVFTGTSASETITGGAGDDTLQGLGSADSLVGGGGNDWLEGGTGQDRLNGGTGADSFVFKDPLASVNWDYVNDFVSGTDKLVFDDAIFTSLGGPGSFAAGDERFVAAPGARYGVEPDDRLMYDTGTGKLYYDPDGSGAGSAYIVGVLQGAPALAATDITVI